LEHHRGRRASDAAVREILALVARKQLKITELSAASGIPRSTLNNKLRGRGQLTVADVVQLAIALDVPAGDLFAIAAETFAADADGTPP
jgi:transcriptional regulator with XRE-family HTH domain